jgi:osmoprotectant transport system ATP-binding protein
MTQIKYDPVTLRDRPVVHRLFTYDPEQFIGARTCIDQSVVKAVPYADRCRESSHGFSPYFGCRFRTKDASKFGAGRLGAVLSSLPVLEVSIEMNAKTPMEQPISIEFRGVDFRINDIPARPIVSNATLTIPSGQTLVLLGRSGSGKTTLLRLINRMLLPTNGQVLVEARATTAWDPIRLRRHIGYVIQEAGLFPHFTVAQNIGLVPGLENWDASRISARVEEMLHLVGLNPAEYAHRLPRELSGGQRQRVGVARALAADPPILLMDEPFGALDPVTRSELQREFRALARRLQKTIVFVTHDLREALLLASQIVLLEAGHIVASAAPEEFLSLDHPEVKAFAASLTPLPFEPSGASA